MTSEKRFLDKVIAITGASTGIGLETSKQLAREGAILALSSSDAEKGNLALRKIQEFSPKSFYQKCDVSNENEVISFFSQIDQRFHRLDGAFNNAGIEGAPGPAHEISTKDFDRVMAINTRGVWLCMKEEIKLLLKSKSKEGSIVNTSSVAGLNGILGMTAYVASKHAVNGMTKTVALELGQNSKIRVNSVCPGPIRTPMLDRFLASSPDAENMVKNGVPLKRIGEPIEVANAVMFLLSSESSYITGHTLPVDGGWCAQ